MSDIKKKKQDKSDENPRKDKESPEIDVSTPKSKPKKSKRKYFGKKDHAEDLKVEKDRYLRLQADFDNFRKRTTKEKNEIYGRAKEDVLLELLPVIDHMDLALGAVDDSKKKDAFVHGIQLVADQLTGVLSKLGVKVIDATGSKFDHNIHEAISELPSDDVPEHVVITQIRKGYMIGDKLLRPAQVVVSRGNPALENQDPASSEELDKKEEE